MKNLRHIFRIRIYDYLLMTTNNFYNQVSKQIVLAQRITGTEWRITLCKY